jgi:NTP pyrophosphatase (non-canonical NTP hydrolase)
MIAMIAYLDHSKRVDDKFLGPGGIVPSSQAVCSSLLEECFEISQEIKAQEDSKNVASSLKPIYDRLSDIRAELENLVLTHRWSLRETDLWNYSLSLQEIDKMRIDGKFVDSEGNRPAGQYVSSSNCHPSSCT